jgi:hypothetical protein
LGWFFSSSFRLRGEIHSEGKNAGRGLEILDNDAEKVKWGFLNRSVVLRSP